MANGAKIPAIRTDQTTVVSSAWCSGQAAEGGASGPLPHSSRRDWVSDETGFHSAIVRSQVGIVDVGANVLATKVSGNITVNMNPLTDSTDRITEPTQIPTQIIANPKHSRIANPATAWTTPSRSRHPMSRPVAA